jgi:hypothetical protein
MYSEKRTKGFINREKRAREKEEKGEKLAFKHLRMRLHQP